MSNKWLENVILDSICQMIREQMDPGLGWEATVLGVNIDSLRAVVWKRHNYETARITVDLEHATAQVEVWNTKLVRDELHAFPLEDSEVLGKISALLNQVMGD